MIPGGWSSHRKASNTQHYPGPVEEAMVENEMIPGEWNSYREFRNTHHDPGLVEDAMGETR